MFRKSPLLISVPLEGTDTVPGLVRLQQRRRQDALEERLGIPKGEPHSVSLLPGTTFKTTASSYMDNLVFS